MHKKSKDISALLDRPHFQAAGENLTPPDPALPTRIRVTLDQLEAYNDNPRLSRNPNYDDIKESIRNRGLDHTPNITRQHPTKPYMIKDGGNTRLAILNELWLETQDRRFFELDCLFYPWTSDLDVLVGHMVENEARGSMLFIERALAAMKTKNYLEAIDGKKISTNELSKRITKLGWSIDHSNLGQLLYAHDTLFPVIPNAFWGSMGRDGVKKIRKILDNARTFWNSVATQDEGDFESIWQSVFMTEDSEAFDIVGVQDKLEAEIAHRLNSPMMAVRGEIQAIAQGISPGGVRPNSVLDKAPADIKNSPATTPAPLPKSFSSNNKPVTQDDSEHLTQNKNVIENSATTIIEKSPDEEIFDKNLSSNNFSDEDNVPTKIRNKSINAYLLELSTEDLMENAYGLAVEHAKQFGFDSCIESSRHFNFSGQDGFHSGFIVSIPSINIQAQASANPNILLHYIYLHQLSSWFVIDQNNPAMELVSINVPLSWMNDWDFQRASRSMLPMKALAAAINLEGVSNDISHSIMQELELTIGIIISRFQAYIANTQQGA